MPHFEIDSTRFHYQERGTGPVALFIHGYPLDGSMWSSQLEGLASKRRCIAIDLRGCGGSDATTLPVLTMEQHAEDLVALLEHLGVDQADIVGLSMGGYVALALAEVAPTLLRTLALVDTKATPDSEAAKEGRKKAAAAVIAEGRETLSRNMVGALLAESADQASKARLRSMVEATPYETIVACLEGMRVRPDRSALLAEITVPTAVIVGEHDTVTPLAEAEAMRALLPNATLHVVPQSGHLSPVERPDEVTAILASLLDRV